MDDEERIIYEQLLALLDSINITLDDLRLSHEKSKEYLERLMIASESIKSEIVGLQSVQIDQNQFKRIFEDYDCDIKDIISLLQLLPDIKDLISSLKLLPDIKSSPQPDPDIPDEYKVKRGRDWGFFVD